jgi:hypothetical protein
VLRIEKRSLNPRQAISEIIRHVLCPLHMLLPLEFFMRSMTHQPPLEGANGNPVLSHPALDLLGAVNLTFARIG